MRAWMPCCSFLALFLAATSQQQAPPPTVASMPPVVVATTPPAGAIDVDPALKEIRVTFSKEMTDGSWSWSTAWEGSSPEVVGKPAYEKDGRTCVVKVKLEPGRTYGYWLNSANFGNFKDKDGRSAVPYLLVFETKPDKKSGKKPEKFR